MKRTINDILKLACSLALGGGILFWMYRDFDFGSVREVLLEEMNWWWMLLSFPFGILAQAFRGWRWKQSLEPLGEHPRTSVTMNSIFLSYAASLVIPRIGEFARCGVLKRFEGVSFPKSLGTVVTERAIDSLFVAILAGTTIALQANVFDIFFSRTGNNIDRMLYQFTTTGWVVTAICAVAAIILALYLAKRLYIYNNVKKAFEDVMQGVMSLRKVSNIPLFLAYTIGIWASYFLHYYLTFFCFESTAGLGTACAMVTFVVGSIAVVVPTPNGAGPWHFAVKTMLILYGVTDTDALYFVLIVHSVQTLLVVLIGVYAWIALMFTRRRIIVQST